MIGVVVMVLAAAPELGSLGSVDGPMVWVDARSSVDFTQLESSGTGGPLPGQFSSGLSILARGHVLAGWGFSVFDRHRLMLGASFTATGVITDPYTRSDLFGPRPLRFDGSPVLFSAAMPLLLGEVALVPTLGVTAPTRGSFGVDPIVALLPDLRLRARFDALVVGLAVRAELPVVTTWGMLDGDRATLRCPREETRCRIPVARELWLAGLSLQGEYWLRPELSVGARIGLEVRDESIGFLAGSRLPLTVPGWSVAVLRGGASCSWSFSEHFGLTGGGGFSAQRFRSPEFSAFVATSWDASLSVWFRTDARLTRMWLDR